MLAKCLCIRTFHGERSLREEEEREKGSETGNAESKDGGVFTELAIV